MDQIKIGKFIAACRKEKNLTQASLAEKLGITDRAISKWETGKSMPDSSIMLEVCEILEIDVNELLKGERMDMENYKKVATENIVLLKQREERSNRLLLQMEIYIGIFSVIILLGTSLFSVFYVENNTLKTIYIAIAFVIFMIGGIVSLKIEQSAGYYQCKHCQAVYQPTYLAVFVAPHIGRTRYMKCPHCQKKSYQKKQLTNEN